MKRVLLLLLLASGSIVSNAYEGVASYYHDKFHGRKTANGEIFDQGKMTCAHKTLPFGTVLEVTNVDNDSTVTVVVNDRGPFIKGREIDLSKAAAKKLGFIDKGIQKVEIKIIKNGKGKDKR